MGVPHEEITRLQSMASSGQDIQNYFLKWWLTNSIDPTWEKLISAVDRCGYKDIACMLKRWLDEGMYMSL